MSLKQHIILIINWTENDIMHSTYGTDEKRRPKSDDFWWYEDLASPQNFIGVGDDGISNEPDLPTHTDRVYSI